MQATVGIDRSKSARGGRLLAGFAIAVAAALALGYGVGHVTAPAGHAAQTIKVLTVPSDLGNPSVTDSCVFVGKHKEC